MKSMSSVVALLLISMPVLLTLDGCSNAHGDPMAGAPPTVAVIPDVNVNLFKVDHPEQFPIGTATALSSAPELVVTGTVTADVSRTVPLISLSAGRVVAIRARLGDTVKAGQVLLSARSTDIAATFSDYRKAAADETLTHTQLERAKDLYAQGAIESDF